MDYEKKDSKIGGAFDQAKGKAKKVVGDVTNNPELEREGMRDERTGEIERKRADLGSERDKLRSDEVRDTDVKDV